MAHVTVLLWAAVVAIAVRPIDRSNLGYRRT